MAGGLDGGRLTRRLEVGGEPDGRAPPVGVWRKKKRRGGAVGPAGEDVAGPRGKRRSAARVGLRAKRKERGRRMGRLGRREKGRGGKREKVFSFFNSFQIVLKLQSNKKPCIRIMMHKNLLFLILSK
jgi:hypothetical protein